MPVSNRYALPMLQWTNSGTFTPAIPSGCVAIQAGVMGGGGGGPNSTTTTDRAVGGGGGAYTEFLRAPTSGATTLTVIVGASAEIGRAHV